MNEALIKNLVWTDYRLAVLFVVLIPLVLLIWAALKKNDAMVRLLIVYWRVASLLGITIYLMIPGWSLGFLTNTFVRLLIPISLWFWIDLNEEIRELPTRPLKLALTGWRWAITIYCLLTWLGSLPFLSCLFSSTTLESQFCQVWFEAPRLYKDIFHANSKVAFLGFLGAVGAIFYTLYFCYFVAMRLGKQGRTALEQ
jgi:hypothetical protein